jgi:hypothetical protein
MNVKSSVVRMSIHCCNTAVLVKRKSSNHSSLISSLVCLQELLVCMIAVDTLLETGAS